MRLLTMMIGVGCLACGMERTRADDAQALRFVPFPKHVQLDAGRFALGRPLTLELPEEQAAVVSEWLGHELRRARVRLPAVRPTDHAGCVIRLFAADDATVLDQTFRQDATEQDYALRVEPDAVTVAAKGTPGLLHGVATLCQLIRANRRDQTIPCLDVEDWPSIPWRAFQDDITRGPSTRLNQLKRDVARGALLKLNIFTYYMQHQFAFARHPAIGPKDGSLTPAELWELVAAARPLGVHIMGNQQSFAHMQHILAHPEFARLRENDRTLSPVNEETYQLLDDLYADVLPVLPFQFFNVCCDETWGLGEKGPSKALAQQIGPGGVYVRHIRRVYDLVHGKYGKRMMMWGDIILKHPDKLDRIPKDVIMLTWGYGPRNSFEDQIVPFAKSGYEFFVCPGVNNWRRVLPHFQNSVVNIRNFVRDGAKHGAVGVLNTSWDDDGENLNAPNWYGFAWSAECAWNASQTSVEDFNRRVGAVLFGEKGDQFGQAIALLSDRRFCGLENRKFWSADAQPIRPNARDPAVAQLIVIRRALGCIEACQRDAVVDADLLDALRFGARRLELYHQSVLNRLDAAEAYAQALRVDPRDAVAHVQTAIAAVRRTRDTYTTLRDRWTELWHRENKPYALDWSLKRYDQAIRHSDDLIAQLAVARDAAAHNKPLPPAERVGLAFQPSPAR